MAWRRLVVREPAMLAVIEDLIKEYGEDGHAAVAGGARSGEEEASQTITEKILATLSQSKSSHPDQGRPAKENKVSTALQAGGSGATGGSKATKSGPLKEEENKSSVKSPKLSRTESMTERTVQKISKMVRGTSRSESRSKKTREPSTSPERNAGASNTKVDKVGKEEKREKNLTKEDKKNASAHEKREIFKSYKKD